MMRLFLSNILIVVLSEILREEFCPKNPQDCPVVALAFVSYEAFMFELYGES
jgi:hypothetical protein